MANVQEMKFIILYWVIVDSLENMKEKALLMLVFIHTESNIKSLIASLSFN